MNSPTALAVDIGGTWVRSALVDHQGNLERVQRESSAALGINSASSPSVSAENMVRYLVNLRDENRDVNNVGISLGAVYQHETGVAIASAPLWGPGEFNFPLRYMLASRTKLETNWTIINDVSAAAIGESRLNPLLTDRPFYLFTMSSGSAVRYVDSHGIPTTERAGRHAHGEIGHIRTSFVYNGQHIHVRCECGKYDHVSSYLSGNGFANLLKSDDILRAVSAERPNWMYASDTERTTAYVAALQVGRPWATKLHLAIADSLLHVITWLTTLDPYAKIVITGGFWDALQPHLTEAILETACTEGPYGIATDRNWLVERLVPTVSRNPGLVGAGLSALDGVSIATPETKHACTRMKGTR